MDRNGISRSLPAIERGDHCCLFYSSPAEQSLVTASFLALGLARGERCIFVGDSASIEGVYAGLAAHDVPVEAELSARRLILSGERDFLDQGHWSTERMLGFLQQVYDSTIGAGFPALRAAGDVSWQVGPDQDYRDVVYYEALLDVFFVGKRMVGLCEYPRDRCPAETLVGILNTHKIAAVDGDVCSNFHYLPPEYFILKDQPLRERTRVEWMTSQLLRAKRAEQERDSVQQQLLQSQKMEAVGRLAGGVVHDFNNILTAILGFSELVLSSGKLAPEVANDVEEIRTSGERAAGLTRQLLAFSRKQPIQPRVLNLNETVAGMEKLLRRILMGNVELKTVLCPRLGSIMADGGHIEQVLMNLAINARDAMPRGGSLTVETSEAELGEDFARLHPGVSPGPHVMLSVSDTGHGMDQATIARIFEPFFTTKGEGRGTGLGLSIVLAIVKQNGGSIVVYSQPGRCSTFKVYFPRIEGVVSASSRTTSSTGSTQGTETLLLVEEDDAVRKLVHRVLAACGYTVLSAISADEALKFCERHKGTVEMLIAGAVLSGMPGRELADQARLLRPKLRFILLSGSSDAAAEEDAPEVRQVSLEKPFTPETLARKVREILDA